MYSVTLTVLSLELRSGKNLPAGAWLLASPTDLMSNVTPAYKGSLAVLINGAEANIPIFAALAKICNAVVWTSTLRAGTISIDRIPGFTCAPRKASIVGA